MTPSRSLLRGDRLCGTVKSTDENECLSGEIQSSDRPAALDHAADAFDFSEHDVFIRKALKTA